jgi:hypothetical protein
MFVSKLVVFHVTNYQMVYLLSVTEETDKHCIEQIAEIAQFIL